MRVGADRCVRGRRLQARERVDKQRVVAWQQGREQRDEHHQRRMAAPSATVGWRRACQARPRRYRRRRLGLPTDLVAARRS